MLVRAVRQRLAAFRTTCKSCATYAPARPRSMCAAHVVLRNGQQRPGVVAGQGHAGMARPGGVHCLVHCAAMF